MNDGLVAQAAPTARVLAVSPAEYLALPGFSASIAKELIARSPLHAHQLHGHEPTPAMDRGTCIHRMVLGKGQNLAVLDVDSYRTKAARAARDEARAAGATPVKAADYEAWLAAATRIRDRLADQGYVLDGQSELAIEWYEPAEPQPVQCRAMLDHVWLAGRPRILDLKITDDASPRAVERTAESLGYAIQRAAYTRALEALRPDLAGRVGFMFAFCEPGSGAVGLYQPSGLFRALGERRWARAIATWAQCRATGTYPGYGLGQLSAPPWALADEEIDDMERYR